MCSAKNQQTGEKVAIKKIGNAFENLTDARRTLREIKLLRHLRHENIIAVRSLKALDSRVQLAVCACGRVMVSISCRLAVLRVWAVLPLQRVRTTGSMSPPPPPPPAAL